MSDYAQPPELLALAKMLDREAFNLRTGAARKQQVAAQLRLIADCLHPER